MHIAVELTQDQTNRLEELARQLGVNADALARAALLDLLAQPAEEFERVSEYVLEKNRQLHERLR
jgi:hypothetical protein